MASNYQEVPGHVKERLEIAILTQERMRLHWEDLDTGMNYMQVVVPEGIETTAQGEFLHCTVVDGGEKAMVRLDMLKNLPTPVKG